MKRSSSCKHTGRAIAARPVVCLGFALLLLGMAPASALAALPTPTLTTTNPPSPGASLTPRIGGLVEEAETKVVTFSGSSGALGPIAQAEEPNNTVRIYTASNCTGSAVAEGTVEALEGEGLLVSSPVAANATTVLYATQSNGLETSPCSAPGLPYRQVSNPPGAPVLSSTNPPSGSNQNFPRLIGGADPEATVSIYANGTCSGGVDASGSGEQFCGEGIQVAVADNSETTFSAKATLAGFVSGCSGPLSYAESTPPPDTGPGPESGGPGGGVGGGTPVTPPPAPKIRTVPGGSANDNAPRVTGSAPGATAVRIYASANCEGVVVAKGPAAELTAGLPVKVMDNAAVVLTAVSVAGEATSKCSDPVTYVEDSLTPRTRITMAPAAKTAKRKAVIRFTDTTGSSPGTTFLCKIDKKKWKQCSSPLRLKKLKTRRYTVRVKASDPAGNAEAKGAKRVFKVIRRS